MQRKPKRFRLGISLLVFFFVLLMAFFVKPPNSQSLIWSEFSLHRLERHQSDNELVIVYFRDDWMAGFDRIQKSLQSEIVVSKLSASKFVPLVANRTLENADSLQELNRISGSKNIPIVAFYPKRRDLQPTILGGEIEETAILDAISRTIKLDNAR